MRSRGAHGLPAIRAGSGTNGADPVHPGIGDVLMALPALHALVERAGAERVEVLVRGSTEASIVRGRSRACGRRASPTSAASGDYAGPPRCDDMASVCIATFNVASGPARWVVRLVGAEWSIGFSRSERKPFDVTLWPVGVHKMEENNRLMAALGIDAAARPYRWVVSPAEARVASSTPSRRSGRTSRSRPAPIRGNASSGGLRRCMPTSSTACPRTTAWPA